MCVCTGIHSQVHVGTWVEAWIQWWRQNKSIIYGCENKEVPNSSWLTTVWVYFLLLLCVVGCGSTPSVFTLQYPGWMSIWNTHCLWQKESSHRLFKLLLGASISLAKASCITEPAVQSMGWQTPSSKKKNPSNDTSSVNWWRSVTPLWERK